MRDDVLDLLRDRNPVPVDPPPPPIEEVLRRLEEHAGLSEDAGRARPSRGRLGGWVVVAGGAAVAAIVVLALLVTQRTGHGTPVPIAPSASSGGLAAPVLRPGQAWYYLAIEQAASPFHPSPTPIEIGVVPATEDNAFLTPSTRAIVVTRSQLRAWITITGVEQTRGRPIGKATFVGSASDRAQWRKEGSHGSGVAGSSSSSRGFDAGGRTLTYAQLRRYPTTPAGVIRFLGVAKQPAAGQFAALGFLLESLPLLPAARDAVFGAITQVPGIQDLGTARDPLGRVGIAYGAPAEEPGRGGLRTRAELIFDPDTMALLASETVLLQPSRIAGISAGYPVAWTAYVASRAVRASSVPAMRDLFGRHGGTPYAPLSTNPRP